MRMTVQRKRIEEEASFVAEVVTDVAESKGCEPTELVPLGEITDPEAIESLLQTEAPGRDESEFEITFQYEGFEITATPDRIDIQELD